MDVFERVVFVSLYLLVDVMPLDKMSVEKMACYLKKLLAKIQIFKLSFLQKDSKQPLFEWCHAIQQNDIQ